jgi:ribulose-phosphate 3-epimerase
MKGPAIVASVLGADYARLGHEVAELEAAGVDRIQWDIMDGHFVPNLSFGADVVAACRAHAAVPFEAHLMVENPDQWLQPFADAGCDTILVHAEACRHLHRSLSRIRALGVRSGVALNPATPLEGVRHVLDQVDVLLVMTVNPGFGGQAYLETMEGKVAEARRLIAQSGLQTLIEVDGGISVATAPRAWKAGAELLVAGSAILAHPEGRSAAVAELRRALRRDPEALPPERTSVR